MSALTQKSGICLGSLPVRPFLPHLPRSRGRVGVVFQVRAEKWEEKTKADATVKAKSKAEEVTEKWGLEAGLYDIFRNKDGAEGRSRGDQAKDLLKRYGSAYLITSIFFAIISFSLCYVLVSSGVDVASLLQRIGLNVSGTSERVGTFAIAYAAHKALSPVRFPPTVALTPVVARLLGKEKNVEGENSNGSSGN